MKNIELFRSIENDIKAIVDTIEVDETKSTTYRTFKVIWADQSLNRNDRILIIDWVDTTNYLLNPVVFINHDSYDVQKIVGKTTKITKEKDQIIFEWVFANNELWSMVWDLYAEWFLSTVSLGYDVLRRDDKDPRMYLESELYEISFVAIPANVNARKMDSVQLEKFNKLKDAWLIVEQEEEIVEVKEDKMTLIEQKLDLILDMLSKKEDNVEVKVEEIIEDKEIEEVESEDEDYIDFIKMFIDTKL